MGLPEGPGCRSRKRDRSRQPSRRTRIGGRAGGLALPGGRSRTQGATPTETFREYPGASPKSLAVARHNPGATSGSGALWPRKRCCPRLPVLARVAACCEASGRSTRGGLAAALHEAVDPGGAGMSYEHILTEGFEGTALITLNRPDKLNALSFGLMQELDEELTRLEGDSTVKAVVLIGAGDKAFSAGADIHEMAGLSEGALAERQAFRNRATWHI